MPSFFVLSRRIAVWSVVFGMAVILVAMLNLARTDWRQAATYSPYRPTASTNANAQVKKTVQTKHHAPQQAAQTAKGGTQKTASYVAASACTPDTLPLTPDALDLASAPVGLRQIATTHYYHVYGYSAAQIRQQIRRCAPGSGDDAAFAGETSYDMNWRYDINDNGTGTCSLSNIKVGLHIQITMPLWRASASDTAGLAPTWGAFAAGLNTHEQGHVALDEQYASKTLASLRGLPTSNCAAIQQTANNVTNAMVSLLQHANANYDAATGHGRTQGAIIP